VEAGRGKALKKDAKRDRRTVTAKTELSLVWPDGGQERQTRSRYTKSGPPDKVPETGRGEEGKMWRVRKHVLNYYINVKFGAGESDNEEI